MNHKIELTTEQLRMVERMAQEYITDLRDDLDTLEDVSEFKKAALSLSRDLDTVQSVLNQIKGEITDESKNQNKI
ncbi:MAG TPA: hypothetical protein DCW74_07345 [Alteromonas australica]|uniref:Uncharacterized protein n=1 Tax=Alteromonas australica TaxID=589873 RepID=A0A350P2L6_9ALTE|nr:hypothetical protein [Alteromonas australica]|tara:strand:+ start:420 stop:644 length:225 start_codon:yes stop_codon:yes gene_type:complete